MLSDTDAFLWVDVVPKGGEMSGAADFALVPKCLSSVAEVGLDFTLVPHPVALEP